MVGTQAASPLIAKILAGVVLLGFSGIAAAQELKGGADYAKDENRRVLNDIIEEAQDALRTLDDPEGAHDERATRNRRERGQPRIVNGRGTKEYAAVGALLKGADASAAVAWCSGTLVASDKFLTAAHCIEKDPRPEQYKVFMQSAGFVDVASIEWQKELYKFPKADIAILHLALPVERIVPESPLTTERPLDGTEGTIVGFGRTGGFKEDYGLKREGFVETAPCPTINGDAPLICWNFSAEVQNGALRSNTCNADSGGPLFVHEVVGGRQLRRIAGVTSGGLQDDCLIGDQSYDVDVVEYSKWILEKAELTGEPVAAGPAPVLDTERDVYGASSRLTRSHPEITFPLDVPDGIGTLMVAMNGEDNGRGRNNFDLYTIRVDGGGETIVCSEEGKGQFAFCRFETPSSGTWKVVVRRSQGEGNFQVVVTMLPSPAP